MDKKALFKLSYGLFIAGTELHGKRSACVINTGIQTTSEPETMSVTMLKTNNTTQFIKEKKSLTLTVLSQKTSTDLVSDFGYSSSRDRDKFSGYSAYTDSLGNPYIKDTMCAFMSLAVRDVIDLGSHYMFLCDVKEAEVLSDEEPMTYADYRKLKSAGKEKKYVCTICHYVYDGDIPFEDLPDDYVCPICGAPKSVFVQE